MVMLSTRFTGSSTSMMVLSSRSALSTGSVAPAIAKCASTKARASSVSTRQSGPRCSFSRVCGRSKNAAA